MTVNEKKKGTLPIIGAVIMLTLLFVVPILGMVSNSPLMTSTIVASQGTQIGYDTDTSAVNGVSDGGWNPKFLVGADGFGYCIWLAPGITLWNDTTFVYTGFQIGRSYTANEVTLNVRKTTGSVHSYQGWRGGSSWEVTSTQLTHIYQRSYRGFMDAAFDNNGNLIVFFSNMTIENGSANYHTFEACVWNASSPLTAPAVIATQTQFWTTSIGLNGSSPGSIASRGAAGQIVYSGANRNLLWNNGTHVFFKRNAATTVTLDTNTYVGGGSMVIAGTKVIVVYSSGATVNGKEVYMRNSTDGTTFTSASAVSAEGKECITPSVLVDSNNKAFVLWSTQFSGAEYWYVIRLRAGMGTAVNISTDYGTLTHEAPVTVFAFQPQGTFYNGRFNIFYIDSTDYIGYGGGITNLVWQYYENVNDLATNVLRVLSGSDALDELSVSITRTAKDEMFVTAQSSPRILISKIDMVKPTITAEDDSLDLPLSYRLTFSIDEADIKTLVVTVDSIPLTTNVSVRAVDFPASLLTRGAHSFSIVVFDECNNQQSIVGSVKFTGFPPEAIITIAIVAAVAVVVVLLLVYWNKNKTRLMKKKLELKMGGKAAGEDTWSDEGGDEEEGPGSEEGGVDLKKDLKKVDM